MKVIREIYDSPWDFTLYETDQGFVLNVDFCNSFFDTTRSYKVTSKDANQNFQNIKTLAEKIRKDYDLYRKQEIIPVVTK